MPSCIAFAGNGCTGGIEARYAEKRSSHSPIFQTKGRVIAGYGDRFGIQGGKRAVNDIEVHERNFVDLGWKGAVLSSLEI